jgi:hypothetical protein
MKAESLFAVASLTFIDSRESWSLSVLSFSDRLIYMLSIVLVPWFLLLSGFRFVPAIVTDFEHQQIAPCVHHGSISTAANFNDTIHSVYDSFIDILLYSYVLSLFWNAVCCHLIFFVSCAKGMRRHYEQTVSFSRFLSRKRFPRRWSSWVLSYCWCGQQGLYNPSSDLINSDGSTKVQATEISQTAKYRAARC